MGISNHEVLQAAQTKWNFLPFYPGLVGGHCIAVDPYYLVYQASQFNAATDLISTSRQVNEHLIYFIAEKLIQFLHKQAAPADIKIVLYGMSFKPNVTDVRNSLSLKLYRLLESYRYQVFAYDPIVNQQHLSVNWVGKETMPMCHALLLTQAHDVFVAEGIDKLSNTLAQNGLFMDIPGVFYDEKTKRNDVIYWSL